MKNYCRLDYCDRPVEAEQLCRSHHRQKLNDPDTKFWPIGQGYLARYPNSLRNELGQKPCRVCKEYKDESNYTKHLKSKDGLCGECKSCAKANRVTNHGLTKEKYQQILNDQNNSCAICFRSFNETTIQVDHDHKHCPGTFGCNICVRGLLCSNCNTAIGLFKDKVMLLNNAAGYLSNSKPLLP